MENIINKIKEIPSIIVDKHDEVCEIVSESTGLGLRLVAGIEGAVIMLVLVWIM
tara:strand:+ start:3206 stop:3367 length:162 start_codon:yes stop_codon:yes gene_type:complete